MPRSPRFDDVYYSSAGGLAEARAVFLEGCGLPAAWAGRSRFTVAELGFGTGLNVLALMQLWRRARPAGAALQIFSVEAFPMPASDARRALAPWPELADLAAPLLARWPRRARGFHRLDFAELGVTLDLAVMDAAEALDAWTGQADAWFLDGFSPARNPGMWSDAVLDGVARRSAPGARAATFTVAGAVRRGLEANGFQVEKKPGFAAKRERLEARLDPDEPAPVAGAPPSASTPRPRIAIVGGGIAGASLARAFRALGAAPVVIEARAPGAGASGNLAALVMPRLDAGDGPIGALYAQALARAADLYDRTPAAVIAGGASQIETGPKDAGRFDRIARSRLFETGAVARLTPADLSAHLGEPVAVGGLRLRDARVIEPAAVLDDWLRGSEVVAATVAAVEPLGEAWRLLDGGGREIGRADIVCLACGPGLVGLAPGQPVTPLRGQVSLAAMTPPPAAIGAGYVIPTRRGLLFGATHDRDDSGDEVRAEDHRRNRDLLASTLPDLAARLETLSLEGRASVRGVTPDFLPLAGWLAAPGLLALSGLGSRGFCAAPLLGEHLAALALGLPSPLPAGLAEIVDPGRFAARRNRRLMRSAKVQVANSI
ncbi:MAG TPA: tRNA (5-methylaminomethyl-2-thiouridine)(34)-methyltransferase MnmD [Caulobacteraceae bacterium]|nr:tRNA (5-methylaminomethyl-2-thiouridine)(34)-methyltransferase MnmD [Caulobacteraceae bacterium]